jgi:predicted Zn-dependent protease
MVFILLYYGISFVNSSIMELDLLYLKSSCLFSDSIGMVAVTSPGLTVWDFTRLING